MVLNGAKNVLVKSLSSHIHFVITHYHRIITLQKLEKVVCRRRRRVSAYTQKNNAALYEPHIYYNKFSWMADMT